MQSWRFLAAAFVALIFTQPAGAVTKDQARAECQKQHSSYTRRQADRTGVTKSQLVSNCIREKMRAGRK
jgi:hypothetical protein